MESLSKPASQAELAQFDELLAPFELASDECLDGQGRPDCLAVFLADPDGFAWLIRKAERRWRAGYSRSPIGLLVKMAREGDHHHRPKTDGGAGSVESELDRRVEAWLRDVGPGYAHDRAIFAEELAKFGIDPERAEELRRESLDEAA